jgi:hypothetical protein
MFFGAYVHTFLQSLLYLRAELPGTRVHLCLALTDTVKQFYKMVLPFPIVVYTSFSFWPSLPTFCFVSLLNFSHPVGGALASHYGFNLHIPGDYLGLLSLLCLLLIWAACL